MKKGRAAFRVMLALALPCALSAQAHPGGRWWTLETAHFRVHVRPDQRELGRRAAGEAEAAYAALAAELPSPRGRIDLVVADHVDEANGVARTYPTPVIVVYAYPPAGDLELGSYDRWLRLVITHELAHIFHLDLARGWWRVARSVFGRAPGLFPNEYAPTWLIEGLAVYYESRLTRAGRLRGSFHAGVVTAAAAEGRGMPIDAAGGLSPRWPGGIRPYAFGSRFLGALAAERGDSAVPRLVRETAGQLAPYLFLNGALTRAAGISFTQAWRGWQDSVVAAATVSGSPARQRAPCVPSGGRSAAGPAREPPCGSRTAVQPRVSPDGRRILLAYADGRDAVRLAVFERGTGSLRKIARLNGTGSVAWSGDRGTIVSQLEFTDPYTIRNDLWSVGLDGRERRLTHGERLSDPDVGPDGTIVAVRAVPGGNELVRRDSAGLHAVARNTEGVEWAGPRFSPDGRTIAATRVVNGRHDIVLLSLAGDVLIDVTRDPTMDRDPAFSPDGRWLFWSREVRGVPQIVGVALDAGGSRRIFTGASFGAYAPAAAADSLFYLAYHQDGFRLESVARSDSGLAPLPPDSSMGAEGAAVAMVPLSEASSHPYRPWPSVLPHFWSPIGEAQTGGPGFYGAFTAGGDALGRHRYAADLALGTGKASGTWRGSLFYQYAGFTRAILDASYTRDQLQFSFRSNPGVLLCCLADESAEAGITVRQRRWRTAYAARLGAEYDRIGTDEYRGIVLSAAASHTFQPALAISTQEGWRLSATLRRQELVGTSLGHTEHFVRASAFTSFEGGGFARHVLAVRGAVGVITGNDNVAYGVGGLSGGTVELLPGVTIGSGSRNFPVRGFAPASEIGRKVGSLSVEVRSPLALVGRGYGLWPATLDRVSMVVFADAGGTIAPGSCADTAPSGGGGGATSECFIIGSVGLELVTDLGIAYDFPVRFRFGSALRSDGGGAAYFAVGSGF
ncbi:MAG: hypothetical protein Q8Q85_01070 [Gemmatimonadales bacterium]|nr:hypothetical protein [Gemmatimonadales bacterium]